MGVIYFQTGLYTLIYHQKNDKIDVSERNFKKETAKFLNEFFTKISNSDNSYKYVLV